MALTDTAIRQAKPGGKPVRMFNGGGLYLEISPAGGEIFPPAALPYFANMALHNEEPTAGHSFTWQKQ